MEEPSPIAGEGYELVFEDDFLGTSLNTDIWVPPPHHGTSFPGGLITVADSILRMDVPFTQTPRNWIEAWSLGPQSPLGNGYPRYPNALAWQEGYFEVRQRMLSDPWTKNTMWMFSLEQENAYQLTRNCSKLNCEWDIFENGGRAGFAGPTAYADVNHVQAFHRNTSGPGVCGVPDSSGSQFVNGSGFDDWHVWGGKWMGTKIQCFMDGTLMSSWVPYDSWSQPMALVLTCAPLNYTQAMIDLWGIPAPPSSMWCEIDWVRVWQRPQGRAPRSALTLPGTAGNYASTPDHPSLQVVGDIDLRIDCAAANWAAGTQQSLVTRYITSGNQRCYRLFVTATGFPQMVTTVTGLTQIIATATQPVPAANGERIAIRAIRDVDNGSAQNVTTFYTGPTLAGPWTQLGNPVTVAGATSIHAGTALLELGSVNTGSAELFNGLIYGAQVRDGIDGPVVARADFTDKTPSTTLFTSEDGKAWTVFGTAKIMPGIPKPDMYTAASPLRLA